MLCYKYSTVHYLKEISLMKSLLVSNPYTQGNKDIFWTFLIHILYPIQHLINSISHTKNMCERRFNYMKNNYSKRNIYTKDDHYKVLGLQDNLTYTPSTKSSILGYCIGQNIQLS